jgi:hypothetical protein
MFDLLIKMKLKDFDVFAKNVEHRFSVKTANIQTNVGGILSIFSYLLMTIYGGFLTYLMISRQEKEFLTHNYAFDVQELGTFTFDKF